MRDVTRREALRKIAVGGAAAATAPLWVESLVSAAEQHAAHYQPAAAGTAWTPKALTPAQNRTVIALAERIIPKTDTAGATEAKVNEFIDAVIADAEPPDREKFFEGVAWVDARSQREHGHPFAGATETQQIALLTAMSRPPSSSAPVSPDDRIGAEFFRAIKSMTITGYYTSEVGLRDEIGDDGTMFFTEFKGCTHPEHQ